MFGKFHDETMRAAADARIGASAWAVLACMVVYSRDYKRARKEHRALVSEWAKANAPGIDVEALSVVSISLAQMQNALGSKSRRAIQDGLARLMEEGIVTRVSEGIKRHPAVYIIGSLPDHEKSTQDDIEGFPSFA